MNNTEHYFKGQPAALVLGALLMAPLAGCVGYDDGPRGAEYSEPYVVVAQDDYVYYPTYGVYYNSHRHEYAYQEGRYWVSRPAPRGVSVDLLLASPSVQMDFHDSPARHHAANVERYPRNWSPPGASHGEPENRRGDKRDEHRGNNDR